MLHDVAPKAAGESTLPTWIRTVRRPIVRVVTALGPRLLPQGDHIVFVSAHSNDPDALVILEYLAQASTRPLVWIAPRLPNLQLLDGALRTRVSGHRLAGLAGLWAFLTSRLVLHTYGVYAVRHSGRRQVVVNVWHGDGPKRMRPHPMATTYMVAGVEEFGRRRMEILQLSTDRLLTTGRPRVDDVHRGLSESERVRAQSTLGLDQRPIIWWLPTWREHGDAPTTLSADLSRYFPRDVLRGMLERYQFVVKPHSNSPRQPWPAPWRVVLPEALEDADVRWYQLLGCAAAVITDYSSVWSDFLNTATPIAFIAPDPEAYADERGFYMSNWRDLLPGPLLRDSRDLEAFVSGLDSQPDMGKRAEVAAALGSANSNGATERLFNALTERGIEWM